MTTSDDNFIKYAAFWSSNCLYGKCRLKGFRLDIAIVGKIGFCREILDSAMVMNIFDRDQIITYHIFTTDGPLDNNSMRLFPGGLSPELTAPDDRCAAHNEPLKDSEIISLADFVAAEDKKTASAILKTLPEVNVSAPGCFAGEKRLMSIAKKLNFSYAKLYGGAGSLPFEINREWNKLDDFTKRSNLSAAAYNDQRLAMLSEMGISKDAVPDFELERLAELEHMRWVRFHLINGWKPGIPGNGKRKDSEKLIHSDLLPYSELSEESREKDMQSVRLMLSL